MSIPRFVDHEEMELGWVGFFCDPSLEQKVGFFGMFRGLTFCCIQAFQRHCSSRRGSLRRVSSCSTSCGLVTETPATGNSAALLAAALFMRCTMRRTRASFMNFRFGLSFVVWLHAVLADMGFRAEDRRPPKRFAGSQPLNEPSQISARWTDCIGQGAQQKNLHLSTAPTTSGVREYKCSHTSCDSNHLLMPPARALSTPSDHASGRVLGQGHCRNIKRAGLQSALNTMPGNIPSNTSPRATSLASTKCRQPPHAKPSTWANATCHI